MNSPMRSEWYDTWHLFDQDVGVNLVFPDYFLLQDGQGLYVNVGHAELCGLLRLRDIRSIFVSFHQDPIKMVFDVETRWSPLPWGRSMHSEWYSITRDEWEIFKDQYMVKQPLDIPEQKLDWRQAGF